MALTPFPAGWTDQDSEGAVFRRPPLTIAAGDYVVLDCRGLATLTILTETGATAAAYRVDSMAATSAPSGAQNLYAAESGSAWTANNANRLPVDWPMVLVSATGGAVRVALV